MVNDIRSGVTLSLFSGLLFLFLTSPLIFSPPASATSLSPGSTVTSIQCAFCLGPSTVTLADTNPFSYNFGSGNSGTVEEIVLTNDSLNPYGLSALTFQYSLNLTGGVIDNLSGSLYEGFQTDVETLTHFGWVAAAKANRTSDGSTVSFNWVPDLTACPVLAGPPTYCATAAVVDIRTDATLYSTGLIGLADTSSSVSLDGYAPSSSVPEPSTILLLGAGLIGLFVFRKRVEKNFC